MSFDADAFIKAHEIWSLKMKGRTYSSRPLSYRSVEWFKKGLEDARISSSIENRRELIEGFLRRAFPYRLSYRYKGDPVKLFFTLTYEAQTEALKDFLAPLARKNAMKN